MPEGEDLSAAIRGFLGEVLGLDTGVVDEQTSLVRSGLLDSVGLVRLAAFLEQRLGIEIPDRDVTVEHFDSLGAIEAYVARRT
jgi:acyl carrier protein